MASKALLDPEFDNVKKMRPGDCHLQWRLGSFSEPRTDRWWSVSSEKELILAVDEIRDLLLSEALPFLGSLNKNSKILDFWEAGNFGGKSKFTRDRYLFELRATLA